MAGRLAEDEPEQAYKHARTARRLASRVGIVREAAGIAAYQTGDWAEALAELRAARRLGAGDDSYLPVMADCERGLGRPERALDVIKSPEADRLDQMGFVELRIVESGVRRDLGQYDAAVVTLQIPELRDRRLKPWSARLFYAYADALVEAGRESEASDWFARAAAADRDGETDAAERYAELEGLHIVDTEEGEEEPAEEGGEESAEDAAAPEEAEEPAVDVDRAPDGVPAPEELAVEVPAEEPDELQAPDEPVDEPEEPEEPEAPEAPEVPEIVTATDFQFKPADPEILEPSPEQAPEAPAVFLEPKTVGPEHPVEPGRPAGDQDDEEPPAGE
ncbi:hypothetical protein [Actinomadura sp. NTSP31]|uniref:hypothetical protein n=1 Tax=Actinomadura sp. NTSP31 TaxID=1735447 RepID=UPI0035C10100